jgi:hypothetical protein
MASPRFEVPSGAIDNVNTVFTLSRSYTPGTVAVFLNGQLKREDYDDGWIETDPVAGVVTLKEPPRSAGGYEPLDVVQIFYIDTEPLPPEVESVAEALPGVIEEEIEVEGLLLQDEDLFSPVLEVEASVYGLLSDDDLPIEGELVPEEDLIGLVVAEDCA